MSFLSFVLSARSSLTLTDAASSSFFKIEHVELQFSLELQNAECRYISSYIVHVTPCVHQLIHRHEQLKNILA